MVLYCADKLPQENIGDGVVCVEISVLVVLL